MRNRTGDPLQSLAGIGPSLSRVLQDIGFREPADLHGGDPEKMFVDLCEMRGEKIDRCVLYTFRCAVNEVTSSEKDPELLKWWNWKNRTL